MNNKQTLKATGKMKGLVLYRSKQASLFLAMVLSSKTECTKKAMYKEAIILSIKYNIWSPNVNSIYKSYHKFKGK